MFSVTPLYNAVVWVHKMECHYKWDMLAHYRAYSAWVLPPCHQINQSQWAGCMVYVWFITLIKITSQSQCVTQFWS